MASPYKVRWGIMATGGIAETFVSDLLIDPTTRGADDVKHEIAAVASRSAEKAQKFIKDMKIPSSANAYGSYKELVNDPNVDVVYVATPHSHHFQNVMLCLEANKHVLCEKAFTVNAEQTKILTNEAKKRKLFLMEAVWTRYFPMCVQIRNLIKEGKIGEVLRVFADTSCNVPDPSKKYPDTNRMVNLDLAGGLLLDVVIYSLTWAFQTLYHTQPKDQRKGPCKISSQIEKYHTGSDESTNILLTFPSSVPDGKLRSQAIATGGFRVANLPDIPVARIQGTKGEIQVYGMCFHPKAYKVVPGQDSDIKEAYTVQQEFPGEGRGMYWEADEVARCLRDGKLESPTMDHDESITIMETMDEIRKQAELKYPESIESTKYPSTELL